MKGLVFSLLAAASAFGQVSTVVFTWDPMPAGQTWKQVRIYERLGDGPTYTYALKAEVAGTETTVTIKDVSPGKHVYVARSVDGWESVDSLPAITGEQPQSPSGVQATVTVTVTVTTTSQGVKP